MTLVPPESIDGYDEEATHAATPAPEDGQSPLPELPGWPSTQTHEAIELRRALLARGDYRACYTERELGDG
jgi:hypothetical protein